MLLQYNVMIVTSCAPKTASAQHLSFCTTTSQHIVFVYKSVIVINARRSRDLAFGGFREAGYQFNNDSLPLFNCFNLAQQKGAVTELTY